MFIDDKFYYPFNILNMFTFIINFIYSRRIKLPAEYFIYAAGQDTLSYLWYMDVVLKQDMYTICSDSSFISTNNQQTYEDALQHINEQINNKK